jgi:acyl-coenzyme A synthetase/AMP-(fatty) acid ligase
MPALPLLRNFALDSVFAYRAGDAVPVKRFLVEAAQLARELPERRYVLNVCRDRYRFCVGFTAALMRGQITLMPPNQTSDMLERLRAAYAEPYRLIDADEPECPLETVSYPGFSGTHVGDRGIPDIAADQVAALMFTSGSTGEPVPHAKTWGALVASGRAGAVRLSVDASGMSLLGTVPPQHMYGLEATVMMPMQGGLAMHAARPFYSADVCEALDALPRPRVLVTTPVHLRSLVCEPNTLPALDMIVCATAPLAPQLAAASEARFHAPLYEIYGCTEAGQVATRRTVETAEWRALPQIRLRQDERGTWVRGGHVQQETLLNDLIELRRPDAFVLHGRHADLVNIAGKRTSLAHLNHHLNSIAGVRDGVFIVPDDAREAVPRLAAFVVAPDTSRDAILAALRSRIDPAFMPRPLTFVGALPRNATGKLPHASLQALAADNAAAER